MLSTAILSDNVQFLQQIARACTNTFVRPIFIVCVKIIPNLVLCLFIVCVFFIVRQTNKDINRQLFVFSDIFYLQQFSWRN